MTKREFLEQAIEFFKNPDVKEAKLEELLAFGEAEIKKMDNSKRKTDEATLAKRAENDKLMEEMLSYITTDPLTATELGEAFDLSTQKVSYIMRKAVEAKKCSVKKVKSKSKSATMVNGYYHEAIDGAANESAEELNKTLND